MTSPLRGDDVTMTTSPRNLLRELELRKHHGNRNYPSLGLVPYLLPRYWSVLTYYTKDLYCGEFSTDGEYFINACKSGEVSVYRVGHKTLSIIRQYCNRNIQWSIIDCKLSPDNRFIAYGSFSGKVHLLPFDSNDSTTSTETHLCLSDQNYAFHSAFCAYSVSFSADSQELIAGTNEGKAVVYDLHTMKRAASIGNAHVKDINCISFSNQTNHMIYSAADDGILKIWDRRILNESHPEPVSVFIGHSHGITWLDSKGDFRYIITNSKDQSIKLWDTRHPSQRSELDKAERMVGTNYLMWDYRQVRYPSDPTRTISHVTSYIHHKVSTLDRVAVDDSVRTYTGHTVGTTLIRARFSPAFSTQQQYIYCGSATGQLFIYNLQTGRVVFRSSEEDRHSKVVRDVSWHPTEPMVFSSSLDGRLGCTQFRNWLWDCNRLFVEDMYDEEVEFVIENH